MEKAKRYDNRLGLKGWLTGGKWGLERYVYTLHRVTGIGLVLYFLLHILLTTSRAFGAEAWAEWMGVVSSSVVFEIGEFLVLAAFFIHGLNGVRLLLVELGIATGKPFEPVYPYKTAIHKQRPLLLIMMFSAAILILIGGYDMFFMGAH